MGTRNRDGIVINRAGLEESASFILPPVSVRERTGPGQDVPFAEELFRGRSGVERGGSGGAPASR